MTNEPSVQLPQGVTLRDYFAAAALQGLLACPATDLHDRDFAKWAYMHADAMMAARAAKEEK